jgi:signal transduction histidine kinase
LKSIFGAINSLVAYIDTDYIYRFANSTYEEWFGLKPSDCIGKEIVQVIGQEVVDSITPFLIRVFNGENVCVEVELPYKYTGPKHVKLNYIPDFNKFGEVIGTFIIITDRTEKKRYQDELLKKEDLIKAIVHNSPGMIYQFIMKKNGETSFPFVSSKAFDIYDLLFEDYKSNPNIMLEMCYEEDKALLMESILTSAKELSPFDWKGRIILTNGKIKWIRAKSTPRLENDGTLTWFGVILDISQDVLLQEELNHERMRAAHSAKLASLGEMSAGVAHEINNPLAIILGHAKIIGNSIDDQTRVTNALQAINRGGERIAKIVNSLQRFSRSETKADRERHTFESIINKIKTLVDLKIKMHGIFLEIEVNSSSFIDCDSIGIEQVLINLINNSIDAVKILEEKWVKLQVFNEDSMLIIRVIDSGEGINKSIESNIFDPFFSTKDIGEGAGLGLSISRGIVLDHDGEINFLNTFPQTCFEVRLPCFDQ